MNSNAKRIRVAMGLRDPQIESLEIFEKICDVLSLTKEPDLADELDKVRALFPTLTDFEREFHSVCFALATGIGKTRLMGAFIAYLYYEKGVKNFFVIAPNLTIYEPTSADRLPKSMCFAVWTLSSRCRRSSTARITKCTPCAR